jgi:hypothetical protein
MVDLVPASVAELGVDAYLDDIVPSDDQLRKAINASPSNLQLLAEPGARVYTKVPFFRRDLHITRRPSTEISSVPHSRREVSAPRNSEDPH